MEKSKRLYPKGSDGLCQEKGCREIAEYYTGIDTQICEKHRGALVVKYEEIGLLLLPHIIRKADKLLVKCLFCGKEWMPVSFKLEKGDPDYGRIPHKCWNSVCKNTILTMVGRKPRFGRAVPQLSH